MKTCPKCQKEYKDDYNFCLADGTSLVSQPVEADSEIEQETIVNFEKPDIGEETMVMDEKPSIGEETAVMNETSPIGDETAVMDKAALTEEEITSINKKTQKQSSISTEEWQEQDKSGSNIKQVIAIPTEESDEETHSNVKTPLVAEQINSNQNTKDESTQKPPQQNQNETNRSYLGLILAAFGLFCLLFIGVVAGGAYLYLQNQGSSGEIASTNDNQDENTKSNTSNEAANNDEANLENTNQNTEETNENTSIESNKLTENSNKENEAKPTPTKETKTPTPKPTPTKTPTPKPTPTRTPTPKPTRTPTPPPPPPTPKPTRTIPKRISKGIVNGSAISLPKPAYPAVARAVRARGAVNVQVIISKSGRVISATAVSGHPLLRRSAQQAARRARFRPTLLSGQPVEVSGVIVYNFRP